MTLWRQLPTWTYELFDLDTACEQFGVFQPLARLWHAKRGARSMPSWDDFDFYDFKGWHGRLAVQEVLSDPFDLRCRLWGTTLTQVLGSDNTGKRYSEIGPSYTANDLGYLMEVCQTCMIGKSHGTLDWLERGHKSVAFIDLPLSNDARATDHLLTALAEVSSA